MCELAIKAHSRLHITLIDLGGVTRRKYGGVGMMLESPATAVTVRPSDTLALNLPSSAEERTRKEAVGLLTRLARKVRRLPLEINVDQHVPEHVGLGSKTALLLAILAAARRALSLKLSDGDLQHISGRGGTSGVGIHGFFLGGCTVDCGQHRSREDFEFLPSSASPPDTVSLLTSRHEIPAEWRIYLLIPPAIRRTIEQEVALFRENTPIPRDEVLDTLATVHHGVVPAVIRADLRLLTESLVHLHQIGFKRRELEAQSSLVKNLYRELCRRNLGAVGMSSWGPTIYVIAEPGAYRSAESTAAIAASISGCQYIATRGWNRGFELI